MNSKVVALPNLKLEGQWLTSRQLAEYLGLTIGAIHMMVHRKRIPFYRLNGRLRFRRTEIDRLLLGSKR